MLRRLFEQYHLDAMLNSLIEASVSESAWWVLDSEDQILFKTVEHGPPRPQDGIRWDLAVTRLEGTVVAAEKFARIQALGDVITRLLTLLLENEMQRQANETERQVAQLESRIHYRISQSLGTSFQRNEISLILLQEVQRLIRASGAIVYVPSSKKGFLLDGHIGETPFGKNPPPRLPKGLLYQTAQSGETLWLNMTDQNQNNDASLAERKARNILALPIRLRDHFYGVIALFNQENEFSSRDVRLLRVLGNYAAIAYHNAEAVQTLTGAPDDANHDLIFHSGESDWQEIFEHSELDWKELGE